MASVEDESVSTEREADDAGVSMLDGAAVLATSVLSVEGDVAAGVETASEGEVGVTPVDAGVEGEADPVPLPLPLPLDAPGPTQLVPVNPAGVVGLLELYSPPYLTYLPGLGKTTLTPATVTQSLTPALATNGVGKSSVLLRSPLPPSAMVTMAQLWYISRLPSRLNHPHAKTA